MKALILAAGYATRLYPLTENTPKCLLRIGSETILDRIVRKLEAVPELTDLLVVTNARFYDQLSDWQKKAKSRLAVKVLSDGTHSNETRLGAIGDFDLAIRRENIAADVLMLASDNLFDQDLNEFIAFCLKRPDSVSVAVYDLGDPELAAGKFGVLEVGPDSRVIGMEEKPQKPKTALIGVGVYFFPKESLPLIADYLGRPEAQDAPGHFVRWLHEKGRRIFGFRFKGMWYDIGDLKSLEEANKVFQSKKQGKV